jgi:Ca2+-binding RTX toxin-like protein
MKTLLALLLAVAGAAVPASPGVAAEDCFGMAPTIVGTDDQATLTGTPGPDVVVSGGATDVDTLAGDDTVCLTGDTYRLDAGDGNDRVYGIEATGYHSVDLGQGSDTYTGGGPQGVSVRAGDGAGSPPSPEADVIMTGLGPDEVTSGKDGLENPDHVLTGDGPDTITVRGHLPDSLDPAAGRDTLRLTSELGGAWRINNAVGKIVHNGVAMAAPSFTRFDLAHLRYDSLRFRGGAADEVVDVVNLSGRTGNGPFSARMGQGDDRIVAHATDPGPFVGGGGDDGIEVAAYRTIRKPDSFSADLVSDTFTLRGFDPVRIATLENFTVSDAPGAVVKGDGGDNVLTALGCAVVVDGRGGDDRISGGFAKSCFTDSSAPGLTAYGGAGADRLEGSITRDRLFGGPGPDRADGSTGRDTCVAEIRVSCEP